jgi:hypothetical protein
VALVFYRELYKFAIAQKIVHAGVFRAGLRGRGCLIRLSHRKDQCKTNKTNKLQRVQTHFYLGAVRDLDADARTRQNESSAKVGYNLPTE